MDTNKLSSKVTAKLFILGQTGIGECVSFLINYDNII